MSNSHMQAVQARFDSDPAFAELIRNAKTREEAMSIAAAHGLEVPSNTQEVTDAELEMVAGGQSLDETFLGWC